MENMQHLFDGILFTLGLSTFLYMVAGVLIGTVIGALPGLGPSMACAILLPIAFNVDPTNALIALAAVYYGSMYGGRISAILLNIPGTAAAVVTCFDGYPLMQQGKGGLALTMGAVSSFVGGLIGFLLLLFIAPTMASLAMSFGSPEYFWLMLAALVITAVGLTEGDVLKGYTMLLVGLLISVVGMDPMTGAFRYTFGNLYLFDGIDFIVVIVGLYGLSEILIQIEKHVKIQDSKIVVKIDWKKMWPSIKDYYLSLVALIQGSVIGFIVGVLPGAGGAIATFICYRIQKSLSKNRDLLGKGSLEGVAVAEAANNSCSVGAMVPMLSLGIPGSGATIILLTALLMFGIRPGPFIFTDHPELVWAFIASLFVGNFIALIVNISMVPLFIYFINVSKKYLNPLVTMLCIVGVYSIRNSFVDIWMMIFFGVLGYLLRKAKYPLTPLLLALVLSGIIERNLRRALLISEGGLSILFKSPISMTLALVTIILILWSLIWPILKTSLKKE